MDALDLWRRADRRAAPHASRADPMRRMRARSLVGSAMSKAVQIQWVGTLGFGFLQKRLKLGPGLWVGDDAFPLIVALLSQKKPREIRHLRTLGLGQRFADADEFLCFRAHIRILLVDRIESNLHDRGLCTSRLRAQLLPLHAM